MRRRPPYLIGRRVGAKELEKEGPLSSLTTIVLHPLPTSVRELSPSTCPPTSNLLSLFHSVLPLSGQTESRAMPVHRRTSLPPPHSASQASPFRTAPPTSFRPAVPHSSLLEVTTARMAAEGSKMASEGTSTTSSSSKRQSASRPHSLTDERVE